MASRNTVIKNNPRCSESALHWSLDFSFLVHPWCCNYESPSPQRFFFHGRGTRLNMSHYNYHVRIKCTIQYRRIQTLRWSGGGGVVIQTLFCFRPFVWSKNKGGRDRGPGPSPGSASAIIRLFVQSVTRNLACCIMSADETILNFSMCSLSFSSFPSTEIKTTKDESGPQSQLIKSYWNL